MSIYWNTVASKTLQRLFHEKVGRSAKRVIGILNLSGLSIFRRPHIVLWRGIRVEVAVHRMKRQVTTSTLTVWRTALTAMSSTRTARFALTISHTHAGLTHRTAIMHRWTVTPRARITMRTLGSHGRSGRSTAGNKDPNRPRKQHGYSTISHRMNSLVFVGNFLQQSSCRRPPSGSMDTAKSARQHGSAAMETALLFLIGRRIVESCKIPTNPPDFEQED